ncbi:Protein of unknown function [Clostridium cavendishii DSM 21758]|uniref:DUF3867 domain-containing protein n=1 Tax=Clostridium cavendishii DSM 21758 TaxID=1121302 RepID=A0A1M6LMQ3_9CLOT|nr:DUF3867 domain-containing protein [Clostridium cavendishii]SHJ72521.1 Protein of unknown function [Clostridium cavendishii DSM 21758]
MDDKIVDFNELKNKARDKDIEKFESYIYDCYYAFAEGRLTMADLNKNIRKYMDDNNISEEKFFNIQKEMMKRYGLDVDSLEEQMKGFGINMGGLNVQKDYESIRKNLSFKEKYKGKIIERNISQYNIKNEFNEVEVLLEDNKVILKSEGHIDLKDVELNEFLCSYKKIVNDEKLNISICENTNSYDY